MKTKNMPERKNMRRQGALGRLLAQPTDAASAERRGLETVILRARIAPDLSHVRTKKDRSMKGKRV